MMQCCLSHYSPLPTSLLSSDLSSPEISPLLRSLLSSDLSSRHYFPHISPGCARTVPVCPQNGLLSTKSGMKRRAQEKLRQVCSWDFSPPKTSLLSTLLSSTLFCAQTGTVRCTLSLCAQNGIARVTKLQGNQAAVQAKRTQAGLWYVLTGSSISIQIPWQRKANPRRMGRGTHLHQSEAVDIVRRLCGPLFILFHHVTFSPARHT